MNEKCKCKACEDELSIIETKLSGHGEKIFKFHLIPFMSKVIYKNAGLRCTPECNYFYGCECECECDNRKNDPISV